MKNITLLFATLLISYITFAQEIELEPYASGFSEPVDLKNAGDDRLFVVEQGGTIKIIDGNGIVLSNDFLDISGDVSGGSEQGLLSIAFHPDYANNGKFYVNYTKTNGDTRVSEFTVDSGNPNLADPNSEVTIIEIAQPFSNHNGGCLQFGTDGYLYIATGDGGSGGDPNNLAQNTTNLLGNILRIDVDNPIPGATNYGIPADNPFAGDPSNREEIWAYGLRNPWKFSFDSATNNLWIADVGQGEIEEINRVGGSEAGLNYGWRCYEGSEPFNTTNCPPAGNLTFPVAEYNHPTGFSITGGYVYNGTLQPSLQGLYFFADFATSLIGYVDSNDNLTNLGSFGGGWSSFGVDIDNELFIVNYSGSVSRIIEAPIIGVEEHTTTDFSFFPNPANEKISLQIENDTFASVSILDIKGSVLFSEENIAQQHKDIDISTLSQGIYLLKVTTAGNNSFTKKLVIQ